MRCGIGSRGQAGHPTRQVAGDAGGQRAVGGGAGLETVIGARVVAHGQIVVAGALQGLPHRRRPLDQRHGGIRRAVEHENGDGDPLQIGHGIEVGVVEAAAGDIGGSQDARNHGEHGLGHTDVAHVGVHGQGHLLAQPHHRGAGQHEE